MTHLKPGTKVSFTPERIAQLDEASARKYRDRTGEVVNGGHGTKHVCVEFAPDGERRPVRLQTVPVQYLQVFTSED